MIMYASKYSLAALELAYFPTKKRYSWQLAQTGIVKSQYFGIFKEKTYGSWHDEGR